MKTFAWYIRDHKKKAKEVCQFEIKEYEIRIKCSSNIKYIQQMIERSVSLKRVMA